MQSDNGSQSPSQESGTSVSPVPPMVEVFAITREDATILKEYVEEFQEGDADLRNTIIANAMAELSALCPELEPFDKAEASKVSHIKMLGVQRADIPFRRLESGFIITTPNWSDSILNSPTSGLHEIPSSTCVGTK
jgi:hypothetical protein